MKLEYYDDDDYDDGGYLLDQILIHKIAHLNLKYFFLLNFSCSSAVWLSSSNYGDYSKFRP